MGPRKPGFWRRADRAGEFVENSALVLVLTAMIVLATAQIVMRNWLDSGFAWADEALRLMVLWVAMLGAVAASRDHRHIAIDVLARMLAPRWRRWVGVVVNGFTAAITFVLAWYSWKFVADSRAFGDQLLENLPAWWFQSILPIGFLLIAYRYTIWMLRDLRDIIAGSRT